MENQNDKQPQQHTLDLNWSPDTDHTSNVDQLVSPKVNSESITDDHSTDAELNPEIIESDNSGVSSNMTVIEETPFTDEPSPFNEGSDELTPELDKVLEGAPKEENIPLFEDEEPAETGETSPFIDEITEDDQSHILLNSGTETPADEEIDTIKQDIETLDNTEEDLKFSADTEPVEVPVPAQNKFVFMNRETALTAGQTSACATNTDPANCGDSIGGKLKAGRLLRKISFLEIEESTKIKKEHVINLENDRFDLLPAPVYTRAYIRKLSLVYSIDPDELVGMYNEKINNTRLQHPVSKESLSDDDRVIDDAKSDTFDDRESVTSFTPSLFNPDRRHSNLIKKALIIAPVVLILLLISLIFFTNKADKTKDKKSISANHTETNSKNDLGGVLKRADKPTIEPEVMDIPSY